MKKTATEVNDMVKEPEKPLKGNGTKSTAHHENVIFITDAATVHKMYTFYSMVYNVSIVVKIH